MKGAATFRTVLSLWMLWLWLQFSSGRSVFPFQSMAMAYKHCIILYLSSPLYTSLLTSILSLFRAPELSIIFSRSSSIALPLLMPYYTTRKITRTWRRQARRDSLGANIRVDV